MGLWLRMHVALSPRVCWNGVVQVRDALALEVAGMLVVTALDDIAWLFNIRGSDVDYNPVWYVRTLLLANHRPRQANTRYPAAAGSGCGGCGTPAASVGAAGACAGAGAPVVGAGAPVGGDAAVVDIAWCSFAYATVTADAATLYIHAQKLPAAVVQHLTASQVCVRATMAAQSDWSTALEASPFDTLLVTVVMTECVVKLVATAAAMMGITSG